MESNLTSDDRGKIGFYVIHNPVTAETYAGSGILGARKSSHDYLLRNNKHYNPRLQAAYNRDPNFVFNGIAVETGSVDEDRRVSLVCEQEIIDEHWGNPLFLNLAPVVGDAGGFTGQKHRPESNERNRQAALTRWQDPEHRNAIIEAQNQGKAAMSDEARAARSANLSSSIKNAYATGVRISTAGQVRSEEFCANNSAKISEKWQDPVYRETQRQARVGKMSHDSLKHAIVVDGVEYESKVAAAKAMGVTKQTVAYRLDSPNFPTWNTKK